MRMSRIEKFFVNRKRRQQSRVEKACRLLEHADLSHASTYLEIGCGTGAVTRFAAAELGLNATGVDIDPEQIALARQLHSDVAGARFLEADAARLPFEDAHFDVVLSFMATHHIANLGGALSEIRRVLKPGGYFAYADIFLPRPIALIGAAAGHDYRLPRSAQLLARLREHGLGPVWTSRPPGQFYGPFEALYQAAIEPLTARARNTCA